MNPLGFSHFDPPNFFLRAENLFSDVTTGVVSAMFLLGLYFFWKNRDKASTQDFLLAGFLSALSLFPFLWLTRLLYAGQVSVLSILIVHAIFFVFFCVASYLRNQSKSSPDSRFYLAVVLCGLINIPFGWFSNTLSLDYTAFSYWWFAPVSIPIIVCGVFARKYARTILSFLIFFNLCVVAVAYFPRAFYGTSLGGTLGVSWWMQEKAVAEVCREIEKKNPAGTTIVEAACKWCPTTLSNTAKVRYPKCSARVKFMGWVSTYDYKPMAKKGTGDVLRVEPTDDKIHLRVRWVRR